MKIILDVLFHTFDYKGKTSREDALVFGSIYGLFMLITFLIDLHCQNKYNIVTMIYVLLLFLPSLSLAVRRLHDAGKSGWWLLLPLLVILFFAPFLFSNPNSVLLLPFIIIEGIVSIFMMYLYLLPSKDTTP